MNKGAFRGLCHFRSYPFFFYASAAWPISNGSFLQATASARSALKGALHNFLADYIGTAWSFLFLNSFRSGGLLMRQPMRCCEAHITIATMPRAVSWLSIQLMYSTISAVSFFPHFICEPWNVLLLSFGCIHLAIIHLALRTGLILCIFA